MRLRSSSRWSRKPMVGICSLSLAESFTGESAAASGIGRYFRSGNRLGRRGKPRLYGGFGRFGDGGFGGAFGSLDFFRGRRIEDTVGQRSQRRLERRQDLLPRQVGAGLQGVNFRLDLRAEFIGRTPELVEEARNLASDLGHLLGAEKDQRQKKQEDHLAGEAEIHASIIMREGRNGKFAKLGAATKFTNAGIWLE